jgi:nitrogen fixation NifU-like protein
MVIEQFDELYREVILDHFKDPRNVGDLPHAQIRAEGTNPLCGDEIAFALAMEGDRISQVRFRGKGCAISQATGSMLTEQLRGKTLAEAAALIQAMKAMMRGEPMDPSVDLGDLDLLAGVRKFPVRVKCAALSWNVLEQALQRHGDGQGGTNAH